MRAGIAVDIALVFLGYNLLLRHVWNPQGLERLADEVLHVVTPVLYVAAWVWLMPKGALRWSDALRWLAFPLVYAAYTFLHGALTRFYPYYFVDVTRVGYPRAVGAMAGLSLALVVLGLVAVSVDRAKGHSTRQR